MSGRVAWAAVAVVVAAGVAVALWQPWSDEPTIVDDGLDRAIAEVVSVRTLTDEITVQGELRRDELQVFNSAVDGKGSDVLIDDGDTIAAGDVLVALDGRRAVAVDGDFAFYRQLDVGAEGPDVLQLETILTSAGHDVGIVDTHYTEDTRAGLAAWQAVHGYGAATSEVDEVVTVTLLSNGAGYRVGARNAASLTIQAVPVEAVEPVAAPSGDTGGGLLYTTRRASAAGTGRLLTVGAPADPPSITVSASAETVDEGDSVTFTFAADPAPSSDLIVNVVVGGDVTSGDDYEEVGDSVLFPAGETTVDLVVTTLVDDDVEPDEDLEVTIGALFGNSPQYTVGGRSEAIVVVVDPTADFVPEVHVHANSESVGESGSASFTFDTHRDVIEDVEIHYSVGGGASAGRDYVTPDGSVIITTGNDSVDLDIALRADDRVEAGEYLTVTVIDDPDIDGDGEAAYTAVSPKSASIEIVSDDLPELTLRGGGVVSEGQTGTVTIVADQAPDEDTSVNYTVSGSAQPGLDYDVISGTALLPAGETEVVIEIRTIDDDVVFLPTDMIVADWPARVGSVAVDEGEFVLQGSTLLSLTEPDFTIRLFATPTERASLDVGQEVLVKLSAGDQEVDGTITQLDDSASTAGGTETYEGVVETSIPLAGVDGAAVAIDVVVDEAVDAVVVPIAAVLRDGADSLVRVVTPEGAIERRPVTTGMLDGAWVEIESGVAPGEYVILEIDRR